MKRHGDAIRITRHGATGRHPDAVRLRRPEFGAIPESDGVRFRVFAHDGRDLRLHLLTGAAPGTYAVRAVADGVGEVFVRGAGAGDRYGYDLGDGALRPDPASRFQPDGVHAPSEVVDPDAFRWMHDQWSGIPPEQLVIYELHVGTFTGGGTFAAARAKLHHLRDLGITAVELMPVADFAGARSWGYDGVCLYAPSRAYGRPDDLRAFVDAAHSLGLAVILDVVYNHLGPEGAYLPAFYPGYITHRHTTPWGGAVNLDGPGSALVRRFIIDNAIHWIREYRVDGLRLDATHALIDDSPTHLVAELTSAVKAASPIPFAVHAEDHRNLSALIEPREHGGWGLDGVWADDFHHVVRRLVAGDAHGYFEDYRGSTDELARTIRQGWLFTGQHSTHMRRLRGTDASRLPMDRFIVCLQNHDQIGNRATGDRLHHGVDAATWRAVSALLLTVPMTPLLFMGQEWAASAPFQYFTDLEPELGVKVTEGRRREFAAFPAFTAPDARERIPDPQAPETFERSRLNWNERVDGIHRYCLELYSALLRLRRRHAALGADASVAGGADPTDGGVIMRRNGGGEHLVVAAQLRGAGTIAFEHDRGGGPAPRVLLDTEDPRFAGAPAPADITIAPGRVQVRFQRPGTIIFRIG